MSKKLIIVGAGETAILAYEYFKSDSKYDVIGFVVNDNFINEKELCGLPISALENIETEYPASDFALFVAVSSGKLNRVRMHLYNQLKAKGYEFSSYISSKAFVWRNVEIGENCFILENNVIQPFVKIGNNVTLWSGNHVGHRSVISDSCFISSHCVISGFCRIGERSFLGVNCTIEDGVQIGKDNFIGAGALIQKNTKDKELYQLKQTELSKVNTHKLFKLKE